VSRYPLPLPPAETALDEIAIEFAASGLHAPIDGGPRRRTWTPHDAGGELLFEDGGGYRLSIEIARDRMSIAFNRPDEDVAGVVLGAAMGALLHLRGTPALHGTAVSRRDRAYVIGGAAGAGKTTLASALTLTGEAEHLSDDLSALLMRDGACGVWPGAPSRLTADEARRVGPRHNVTADPGTDGKHWLRPPGERAPAAAVPLKAVLLLEPRTQESRARVERLPRAVACARLASSLYGGGWLDVRRDVLLARAARITELARVYVVALPDDRLSLTRHAIHALALIDEDLAGSS
jgi:hypothetical protein